MAQLITRNPFHQIIVLGLFGSLILVFIGQTVAQLYATAPVDETHLEASSNPGLKIRLSQPGLNYGASVAVDILAAKVGTLTIPDQSGRVKVPVVGHVDYTISNIKVSMPVAVGL